MRQCSLRQHSILQPAPVGCRPHAHSRTCTLPLQAAALLKEAQALRLLGQLSVCEDLPLGIHEVHACAPHSTQAHMKSTPAHPPQAHTQTD